ncbi:MAG: hypothetical protein IKS42_11560 [Oscillospiraceae bacterium]|nr:hypothetical protein [Oscillospiraceae bacterium]
MANYRAITGEQILKKIRGKNIIYVVLGGIACLAGIGLLILAGTMLHNDDDTFAAAGFVGLAFIVCGLFGVIKGAKVLKNVENLRIFRKFGSPDELAARISEGCAASFYETSKTLVTESFIMKQGDFESYKPFEDIILIYKKEHRVNGIKDSESLVAYDKFGDSAEYPFKLGRKYAGKMEETANLIAKRAPECLIGYTDDNLSYVKTHAQQL